MSIEENTLKVEELLYTTDFPQDIIDDYVYSIGCKKKFKGEQHKHGSDCERIDHLIVRDLPRSEDDVATDLADAMEGIVRYNHGQGCWEVLLDGWELLPSDFSLHNLLRRHSKMYTKAWDYYGKLIRDYIDTVEALTKDADDKESNKKVGFLKQLADSHYFEAKKVEKLIDRLGSERGFASIITLVKGHEKVRASTSDDAVLSASMFKKASQVSSMTAPTSLVHKMLPAYGMGQIFGKSQAGKSFVAHDLARHIAAGVPEWMGQATHSKEVYDRAGVGVPRDVFYIVGESPLQFRAMVDGWTEHNPRFADVAEEHFHSYINGDEYVTEDGTTDFLPPFTLDPNHSGTKASIKSMRAYLKEAGINPAVIVIDTQSSVTGSIDENSAAIMEKHVLGPIRRWANEDKVMILLVHHAGKADGADYRGSGAQFAAMDVVWEVTLNKSSGIREIEVKKLKADGGYGPEDKPSYMLKNSESGLPYMHYVGVLGAKAAKFQEAIGTKAKRKAAVIETINNAPEDVTVNGQWLKAQFDPAEGVVDSELRLSKNPFDKLLKEMVEDQSLTKHGTNKNIYYTVTS